MPSRRVVGCNADGNRVAKTEGGVTRHYVNGWYEVDTTASIATVHYAMDGSLVAVKEGSTLRYVHSDHLGSSSVATDTAGAEVGDQTYLPYGDEQSSSGTLGTERRFTGQRFDGGSGLYFYNARYYDATIGRFISADTIIPVMANPQAWNRYSYVFNNPVRYTDESGNCPWCVAIGIGAGVGALVGSISYGVQVTLDSEKTFKWGELAEATVSGAVAGGLSVAATVVIVATGGTGAVAVGLSVAGSGAAGGAGYGAGEVAENIVSPFVGDSDQSSPNIRDALISTGAGAFGGFSGQGVNVLKGGISGLSKLEPVTPGMSLVQGSAVSAFSSNLVTSLIPGSSDPPLLTHTDYFDGPSDLIYQDY